jgi:hypothetical protein
MKLLQALTYLDNSIDFKNLGYNDAWQTLKTFVLAQQSTNKASAPCKWKCSCGKVVVGDYCKCGAYRCDL